MRWIISNAEDKGQSSIEYILIVGALMVIVIYAFPFVSRHVELNKGIAAARDGAQFGATMRGMGFTSSDISNSLGVIKIDRIDYDIIENPDSLDNVSITIYVRGPPELKTTSVISTIRTEARRFTGRAISGEYTDLVSARAGEYYIFQPIQCSSDTWIAT